MISSRSQTTRRFAFGVSLFGIASVLVMGCSRLPKTIAGFPEVSREIKTMTVIPTRFALEEAVPFGANSVPGEITSDVEAEIKSSLEQLIGESRYGLVRLDIPGDTLAAGSGWRGMMDRHSSALAVAAEKIASVRGKTIDVDWTADPDSLAARLQADYLLFVQGSGYFTTAASAVKSALLAGFMGIHTERSGFSNTTLWACLVDARRRKVLWYNCESWDNKDPRKPSHVMKTCQRLMAPLLGKSRIVPDPSRDERIIEKLKGR